MVYINHLVDFFRILEATKILSFDHISTNQFIGNPETV